MAKAKKAEQSFPVTPVDFVQTLRGRGLLVLATVLLLWLAPAPAYQFYLAWVGLVPWLVLVGRAQSLRVALWWSLLVGFAVFASNLWWLVPVTIPGALGLVAYLALWFLLGGWIIHGLHLLQLPVARSTRQLALIAIGRIVLLAAMWVTLDWLRGWLFTGLPWAYLGHSQTPVLALCQIADITGAHGVTFWVVLINAWVAIFLLNPSARRQLALPGLATLVLIGASLGYGIWRIHQDTGYPGPTVMVVQANFPQDNSGNKGAAVDEIVHFHFRETDRALDAQKASGTLPDLVAWSETMLPEMNAEFRDWARRQSETNLGYYSKFLDASYKGLGELTRDYGVHLISGAVTNLSDRTAGKPGKWLRLNSAIYFDSAGRESSLRYDKIHLVPFGEFIPFRESFPPLYHFFNIFNPYPSDYTVTAGKDDALTVFPLPSRSASGAKFVTPICFEDLDAKLVARMIGGENGTKRADFIVNLTNDGWFRMPQMPQHLQIAVFRSIENRVPTARSVNTGISAFIDSVGRVSGAIAPCTTGVSTARLTLDRRVTLYTRFGDLFAGVCALATGVVVMRGIHQWMKNRRRTGR